MDRCVSRVVVTWSLTSWLYERCELYVCVCEYICTQDASIATRTATFLAPGLVFMRQIECVFCKREWEGVFCAMSLLTIENESYPWELRQHIYMIRKNRRAGRMYWEWNQIYGHIFTHMFTYVHICAEPWGRAERKTSSDGTQPRHTRVCLEHAPRRSACPQVFF
jgi:hypothetical protein